MTEHNVDKPTTPHREYLPAKTTLSSDNGRSQDEHAYSDRFLKNPALVLRLMTWQTSTFTRRALVQFLLDHTPDHEVFSQIMEKISTCPDLVQVGRDRTGQDRFSSAELVATEEAIVKLAHFMNTEMFDYPVSLEDAALACANPGLSDEQVAAARGMIRNTNIAILVGYAGTGKSTMLRAICQAWAQSGYTVRGAALSGIAAEGLEGGSGIKSRTLASLEYAWSQDRNLLEPGHILVVDEAGMIGSRLMARILYAAWTSRAKLVLIGDPEQLQAIEAGAGLRAALSVVTPCRITIIRRQQVEWQKHATMELATGKVDAALNRYEQANAISGYETLADAHAGVVENWNQSRLSDRRRPCIMLAHRRKDVRALNELARATRKEAGELGTGFVVTTTEGKREMAIGERIYFLANDKAMDVRNGTLGTIQAIAGHGNFLTLLVMLDSDAGAGTGRKVIVPVAEYASLEHGYAATIHKAQGITVDHAHVLATKGLDRHASYVALSRHRWSLSIHWAREDAGNWQRLVRFMSRKRLKDTTLDYRDYENAMNFSMNVIMPILPAPT